MNNLSQFFSRIMNDLIKTQLRIFDVHCIFLSIIEIYTKQKVTTSANQRNNKTNLK